MRNFAISDIHGNGNLYYSVISYIENISKYDDVTLYINGDLIDRGQESAEILIDLIRRIHDVNNPFKIEYLGGNHELLMYNVFEKRRANIEVPSYNDWYGNGGFVTDKGLENNLSKKQIDEIVDYIGNLKLYHKFKEEINGKKIVLVHACCPKEVKDECDLKICEKEKPIFYIVWTRKNDPFVPFKCRIGNKKYFSIVGHSANEEKYGYMYDKYENYLNIDGGSAMFVYGMSDFEHFPLVEINNEFLKILTFNNKNEIIYGNYLMNNKSILFSEEQLDFERSFLNKKLVLKSK